MISGFNVYAVGVALALGIFGYVQTERLEDSRAALKAEKEVTDALKSNLAAERKTAQEQAVAREQYVATLEKANAEINDLRAAVDDGNKRLRIKANCPAVPKAGADSTGTEARDAELADSARRSYFDLRQGIITLEARHKLCLSEIGRIHRLYGGGSP